MTQFVLDTVAFQIYAFKRHVLCLNKVSAFVEINGNVFTTEIDIK